MKDGASNGNQIAEESSTSEDGKKETAEAAAVKKIKRENLRKRSTSVDRSSSSSSSSSSESEEERKKKKKKYRKRKSRSPKRKHTKSKKSRKSRERSVSSDRSASRRTKERSSPEAERLEKDKKRNSDAENSDSKEKSRSRSKRKSRSRDRRSRSRDRRSRSRDRRSRSRDKKKRSRSRDRTHKSRDRRNVSRERRSRSRDRRRSRDGKRRSRSRDRRNSRSRDRRRSRSRERRRSRSRDRSRRRRSQSRDRRPRSSSSSPYRFGFDKAMDSQERLARRLERAKELTRIKQEEEAKKRSETGLVGLKDTELRAIISFYAFFAYSYRFLPFFSTKPSPQMLALKAQAEKATGITIPSYYNPNVINPLSYATQEAKRKKLWSKAEVISLSISGSVWSKMTLGDNKTDEKFAKLMGIKSNAKGVGTEVDADGVMKKQQELMSNLDMQYQQARITTHTQRGVGLGFSSAYVNPNAVATQQAADNTAQPPPAT
uniref:Arginine/serine-rich coiled-coil protein 2 n=1 Tax=Ciona intestinalis TaxID=7719 RepID=F6QJH8_CIOIN